MKPLFRPWNFKGRGSMIHVSIYLYLFRVFSVPMIKINIAQIFFVVANFQLQFYMQLFWNQSQNFSLHTLPKVSIAWLLIKSAHLTHSYQVLHGQERKRKIAKQEILIVMDELDTIWFQNRHDTVSTIYSMDNLIGRWNK